MLSGFDNADYRAAIESNDREIKGYIRFNNDFSKVVKGDTGLISMVFHQNIMDAERCCIGSCTSSYADVSFFTDSVSGVSFANSYFEAYVGVQTDAAETVYLDTTTVSAPGSITLASSIADGESVKVIIGGTTYETNWTSTGAQIYVSDTLYNISGSGTSYNVSVTLYPDAEELFTTVTLKIVKNSIFYKRMGWFVVTETSRGKNTTALTAYDYFSKLNVDYVPTVTATSSGYRIRDIVNDISNQTGAFYNITAFASTYVPELFTGTCREQLGWLMTMAYNTGVNVVSSRLNFNNGKPGFTTRSFYSSETYYSQYTITDSTIYLDGFQKSDDDFTVNSITSGTVETPITSGNGVGVTSLNPYMTQTKCDAIYNTMNGMTYTPMTVHFRGDPCLDPGDVVKVTTDGTDYKCYIMQIVTTFNGGLEQTLTCWGDSEAYYEMSTSPMETQIQRTNTLLQEMQSSIETANGGVITKILDTDGTWKELVIANSQDLASATSVWRWNINGLAHSTAYSGGTYNFALDDQGRIVASMIQTGILTDANGYNSWNLDTGAFTITNGSINITTSSATSDEIKLTYYLNATHDYEVSLRSSAVVVRNNAVTYGSSGREFTVGASAIKGSEIQLSGGGYTTGAMLTDGSLYLDTANGNEVALHASAVGVYGAGLTFKVSGTNRLTANDTALTFYDSSGTVTATYPNTGLYVSSLNDCQNETITTSGTTKSYTLTNGTYLVTTSRVNSTLTSQDGVYLVEVHNNAHISTVYSGTGTTTVSVSGQTLTVTTGSANVRVTITRL